MNFMGVAEDWGTIQLLTQNPVELWCLPGVQWWWQGSCTRVGKMRCGLEVIFEHELSDGVLGFGKEKNQ